MILSNLHTHSTFSDGADSPAGLVETAVRLGLKSIGISDHCYTPCDPSYCMKEDAEVPYLEELTRLKEVYRGRIEIAAGLEYDGFATPVNPSSYDYLIGDCHYLKVPSGYQPIDETLPMQKECIDQDFGGDPLAYAAHYYRTYTECTALHRPDILGHFDLAAKFGLMPEDDPAYRKIAVKALRECLAVTPVFEVNTGAITRGVRQTPYPDTFLLEEALRCNALPVLASDAHRAEHLTAHLEEAASLLRSVGFKTQIVYLEGKLREYPL